MGWNQSRGKLSARVDVRGRGAPRALAGLLLTSVLLLAACASELPTTEVMVVVDSDLVAGAQLTRIEAKLFGAGGGDLLRAHAFPVNAAPSSATYTVPLSFSVAPDARTSARDFRLVVTGWGPGADGGEREVVEQQVITEFQPHVTQRLDVYLARRCLGRMCRESGAQTCDRALGTCGGIPLLTGLPRAEAGPLGGYVRDTSAISDLPPPNPEPTPPGEGANAGAECVPGSGAPCPPGQRCATETGSPHCVMCDDVHCANLDNCPLGACANGTCVDGVDDYRCDCAAGYAYDPATKRCNDINDCMPGLCAHGRCVDGVNSYSCTCDPGYVGSGTRSCSGGDDCPAGACANGVCIDGDNTYSCRCNPGFMAVGTTRCASVNDCPAGACANGTCRDGVNSWDCVCNAGFDGTGTQSCRMRDPCLGVTCANGRCAASGSDAMCVCNPGYRNDGPRSCVDIDECAATPSPCGRAAVCANMPGTHACRCAGVHMVLGAGASCTCEPGWGDCDATPGCETSLVDESSCAMCPQCFASATPQILSAGPGNYARYTAPTCAGSSNVGYRCAGGFGGWRYGRCKRDVATQRVGCEFCADPNNPNGNCSVSF